MRIALATDILKRVYTRGSRVNKKNLIVLERVRKSDVDPSTHRELERRVLGARKSELIASNALAGLDEEIKSDAENLYEDVLRMQATWTASIKEKEPKSSMSVRALELSLQAALKRKDFSILPYLPNPRFTASLSYDVDRQQIDWGLSLSLSYVAVDKGENALSVLKREENPQIFALKLGDARKNLSDGIRKTRETLEILDLDRKLQELDIADAQDDVNLLERLYNGGYASEEDLVIIQIDLSVEQIEAQRIDHDILIQTLNLANYYAPDSGGAQRLAHTIIRSTPRSRIWAAYSSAIPLSVMTTEKSFIFVNMQVLTLPNFVESINNILNLLDFIISCFIGASSRYAQVRPSSSS